MLSGRFVVDTVLTLCRDPDAVEFAKDLDGLPLASTTAGAYLNQVATSFADYLRCTTCHGESCSRQAPS